MSRLFDVHLHAKVRCNFLDPWLVFTNSQSRGCTAPQLCVSCLAIGPHKVCTRSINLCSCLIQASARRAFSIRCDFVVCMCPVLPELHQCTQVLPSPCLGAILQRLHLIWSFMAGTVVKAAGALSPVHDSHGRLHTAQEMCFSLSPTPIPVRNHTKSLQ